MTTDQTPSQSAMDADTAALQRKAKNAERMRAKRAAEKAAKDSGSNWPGFAVPKPNAQETTQVATESSTQAKPQPDVESAAVAHAEAAVANAQETTKTRGRKNNVDAVARAAGNILAGSISTAAAAKKAAKAAGAETLTRSEGVAKSWSDPDVRAKRMERTAVLVEGIVYASVAKAFRALRLPMQAHVKFRAELKAAGKHEINGKIFKVTTKPVVEAKPKKGKKAKKAKA